MLMTPLLKVHGAVVVPFSKPVSPNNWVGVPPPLELLLELLLPLELELLELELPELLLELLELELLPLELELLLELLLLLPLTEEITSAYRLAPL